MFSLSKIFNFIPAISTKDSQTNSNFSSVPKEVQLEIFKLLPDQDLIRCQRVCKDWKTVTDDEKLWKPRVKVINQDQDIQVLDPKKFVINYLKFQQFKKMRERHLPGRILIGAILGGIESGAIILTSNGIKNLASNLFGETTGKVLEILTSSGIGFVGSLAALVFTGTAISHLQHYSDSHPLFLTPDTRETLRRAAKEVHEFGIGFLIGSTATIVGTKYLSDLNPGVTAGLALIVLTASGVTLYGYRHRS